MVTERFELFDLTDGHPTFRSRHARLWQAQRASEALLWYEIWRDGRRVDCCRRVRRAPVPFCRSDACARCGNPLERNPYNTTLPDGIECMCGAMICHGCDLIAMADEPVCPSCKERWPEDFEDAPEMTSG